MPMTKEQKRKYERENIRFFKKIGICIACEREKAFGDHVYCPDCLDKHNEYERKYKQNATEEQRQTRNEARRKKYYEHKKQGLCVNCNRKATPGYVYCTDCRIKLRRSNQRWVVESGRKKGYAEAGLCIRCGADPVKGRKLCADCLDRQRKSMAHARQFAPTGQFWEC